METTADYCARPPLMPLQPRKNRPLEHHDLSSRHLPLKILKALFLRTRAGAPGRARAGIDALAHGGVLVGEQCELFVVFREL